MLSMLKDRFGIPGVIATVALVFAMTGGAIAAKYVITSTSQIKPSVLKKLKGPSGPAGAVGPTGLAGPVGPVGAKGKDGAPGAPGKDGTNGAPGSPWTAGGTLPSGSTETGAYAGFVPSGFVFASISFNVPLAAPLDGEHQKVADTATGTGNTTSGSNEVQNVIASEGSFSVGAPISGAGIPAGTTITATGGQFTEENPGELTLSANATATGTEVALTEGLFPECENAAHAGTASPTNPEADPGYLCVFPAAGQSPAAVADPTTGSNGAATSGGYMAFNKVGLSRGTWAVTAQ
jgi:hypothetical protein